MVVEKGLGALLGIGVAKTAMDNLSEADRTVILAAAMTGKADAIERLTQEQLQATKEALIKANPDKTPTDAEVAGHAYQSFYDRAFADSDFGTGGKVQRAIQAATAAVQGLAGGDLVIGALMSNAGASAGYVAGNIIKVPMDKVLNPVSKQYEWVPTGVWTITKPVPQHPLQSIVGNMGDSAASELLPKYLEKKSEANK